MLYAKSFVRLPKETRKEVIRLAKVNRADVVKANRKECLLVLATGQQLVVKL